LRTSMENNRALEVFRSCLPLFQALGDKVRQDIVILLIQHEALNVSQIAEKSPMSRPTISHHLKILRDAGLVVSEKRGTENYYSLTLDVPLSLLKQLIQVAEDECI
jgi:ArsR family transcriptional regulator